MSHYNDFKTQITDPMALVRALKRVRTRTHPWTEKDIEVHGTAVALYGYHGDKRAQTANIVIRRHNVQGAANDLGFVMEKDGTYTAIISDYDQSYYNKTWQAELYTYYNVEKSKMEFESHGIEYEESKDEVGRIVVQGKFKQTNEPGKVAVHL